MFLARPRHEILGFQGARMPYSAKLLYDLCAYRDKPSDRTSLNLRVFATELGFITVAGLALIEAAVRLPFAFLSILFSSKPRHWIEGAERAIMTTLYGTAASVANLFSDSLVQTLIDTEAKFTFYSQNELLFQACENGLYKTAKALIANEGADPHKVLKKEVSAALVPNLVGHEDLQELFKHNKYEQGYLELKRLAHWLSLEGTVKIDGRNLTLQGAQGHWFFESMAEALQRFRTFPGFGSFTISTEKADELEEALITAYATQDYERIATRARDRKPTFINTGWKGHAVCVAFCSGYMAIGNTGTRDLPTLQVFKIDTDKITRSVVEEIFTHLFWDVTTGQNYFYHTLPRKLSLLGQIEKDGVCNAISKIGPCYQTAGNCALASKKAALRFVWAMLAENPPSKETILRARLEVKLFCDLMAKQYLEDAELASRYPHLEEFADIAHRKGEKKERRLQWLCIELRDIPGLLRSIAS